MGIILLETRLPIIALPEPAGLLWVEFLGMAAIAQILTFLYNIEYAKSGKI
jgi:hypothetical protein